MRLSGMGGFTHVRPFRDSNTEFLFFNVDACKSYFKYESKDKENQKQEYFSDNRRRNFVEGDPKLEKYCIYGGMLKVAGTVNKNGSDYWIVTFEPSNGLAYNLVMERKYDGYVLLPEFYESRAYDSPLTLLYNNGYAKVFFRGSEMLFQKKI